ncbi:MAG: calcium/sodium antiporter [Nanoarchaeota archaeon]|nr:calcium/sodium antiporter [Nanoarchaeota archaeon]MBU1320727.1 calcium/sodium antiporter [Nanoarchaeota archaeon]MBU1598276.1 calcium/sodium antiporter [Nanoarchaeota archaeon]MBU2442164.1 calcium/sodium antiporter [Nanoarchaeota archaeon]
MLVPILLLILGLVLLWVGSDFVVESAKKIAQKLKVSQVFIGLTVVSIGTSLPEIFTNIFSGVSNLKGVDASGLAVGVNIGSSIGLMTLVVGLVAFVGTLHSTKKTLSRDGPIILISILLLFVMGFSGFISRTEGIILMICYGIYIFFLARDERNGKKDVLAEVDDLIEIKGLKHHPLIVALLLIVGLALLILGSKFVVDNALKIAAGFNFTQTFVGVVIIGVGGFLPELSTALKGIIKKAHSISLGTLIGSNITNPLFSMGIGAAISGLTFNRSLLLFELPFWALTVLTVMLLLKKDMFIDRSERKEGMALIALYIVFVVMKIVFFKHV